MNKAERIQYAKDTKVERTLTNGKVIVTSNYPEPEITTTLIKLNGTWYKKKVIKSTKLIYPDGKVMEYNNEMINLHNAKELSMNQVKQLIEYEIATSSVFWSKESMGKVLKWINKIPTSKPIQRNLSDKERNNLRDTLTLLNIRCIETHSDATLAAKAFNTYQKHIGDNIPNYQDKLDYIHDILNKDQNGAG